MNQPLERGEYIRIRAASGGEWCDGFVALASNGSKASVMVLLNGAVRAGSGVILNALPLTIDYDAQTVVSLLGDEYEIERQEL